MGNHLLDLDRKLRCQNRSRVLLEGRRVELSGGGVLDGGLAHHQDRDVGSQLACKGGVAERCVWRWQAAYLFFWQWFAAIQHIREDFAIDVAFMYNLVEPGAHIVL